MVIDLLVALLCAAVVLIALLLMHISALDRERRALLDRLLVANSIMPVTPTPPAAVKKEASTAQRIKFKLYP